MAARSAAVGGRGGLQADPSRAAMRVAFTSTLREVLEVLTARLLARSSR